MLSDVVLDAEMRARIARMPKAEIHVHLEGATTAQTYFEIAQRNGAALAVDDLPQWQEYFTFKDFAHFIDVYVASTKALRSADDYLLLVQRFGAQQAALNVRYSETFVSCSLLSRNVDRDDFLGALAQGAAEVEREHGVIVRFIADISREIPDSQTGVLELAIEGFRRGVFLGLGLGGPEIGFPPELYAQTYKKAREAGMMVVAHAGETVGARSVRGALDALGAQRIGHGVLSLEDPSLIARLAEERIPLEVCPQSNYRLGVVATGDAHPIRALHDAGVLCTVNSDDPAMFETDINREYETLAAQGFRWDELMTLSRATLESTFATDDEKTRLRDEWDAFEATLEV